MGISEGEWKRQYWLGKKGDSSKLLATRWSSKPDEGCWVVGALWNFVAWSAWTADNTDRSPDAYKINAVCIDASNK